MSENKSYPEWVQTYRTQGKTVKKVGGSFYLYKRTSKRVPGKKYPQPVDTYIGIITPEGVIKSDRKRLSLTSVVVKEYGFSKALWELCPEEWKKSLGDDWADILTIIITKWSPYSYLTKERVVKTEEGFHCSFSAQAGTLIRRIYKEFKATFEELKELADIYLVYIEKQQIVSEISQKHRLLLDRLPVRMEVD